MSSPLPPARVCVRLADELPANRRALPALAVESLTTDTLELERDMLSASNELTAAEERRFVRGFFVTFLHLAARLCDLVTRHFFAAAFADACGEASAMAARLNAIAAANTPLMRRRGWGVMRVGLSDAPAIRAGRLGKGSQPRWRERRKAPIATSHGLIGRTSRVLRANWPTLDKWRICRPGKFFPIPGNLRYDRKG